MKVSKRILTFALCILLAVESCACRADTPAASETVSQSQEEQSDTGETQAEGAVTVTDIIGRQVTVTEPPARIAAVSGPSYEMAFMLGAKDRVVMVKSGHTTNYPIALLTNPDLADYLGIAANPSSSVNIEDYLQNDIDLVIYYDNETELKKFDNAKIPAAVLTVNTGLLDTLEEAQSQTIDSYIETTTYPVRTFAVLLQDEKAAEKAERWYAYCDKTLRMIYERTGSLTDEQRSSVYWSNTWGENVLSTYVLKNRWYEIWLAGGKLIGPDGVSGNFPEITREQMFTWDPEIILVDNHGGYPELVEQDLYQNERWASLQAVQNKQIYRIPAGVFFLDKGSTTTLMVLWLSTILQPELFADIDMVEEIQYYYREFYEYELTAEEAQHVLDGWFDQVEAEE